ncbi:hypothetical protein F4776DRAFT_418566 [Hypoxylon sp. NC0597]|nr:hypothetical protein F4776DRAFT_418566 [Hypoxylon sp. NC0597]
MVVILIILSLSCSLPCSLPRHPSTRLMITFSCSLSLDLPLFYSSRHPRHGSCIQNSQAMLLYHLLMPTFLIPSSSRNPPHRDVSVPLTRVYTALIYLSLRYRVLECRFAWASSRLTAHFKMTQHTVVFGARVFLYVRPS